MLIRFEPSQRPATSVIPLVRTEPSSSCQRPEMSRHPVVPLKVASSLKEMLAGGGLLIVASMPEP